MKIFVSKLMLPLIIVALGILPQGQSQAQGNAKIKPAVVVSVATMDEQFADAEFLFRAAGLPTFLLEIPKAEVTVIDSKQPIGAYLTISAENEPQYLVFLPITDLDMALEKIEEQIDERSDAGNGVTQLAMVNGNDVFFKKVGSWTFASDSKENLSKLPDNPVAVLGGLEKTYNVAVQINAMNVPNDLKKQAVGFMQNAFEETTAQLEGQGPDLKQLTETINGQLAMKKLEELVLQTEQLTVGWAVDTTKESTFIDFTMTAMEGSDLAKELEINAGAKSEFAGFLMPGSAANMNFVSKMTKSDSEMAVKAMGDYRKLVLSELEKDENLSDEELEVTREMIGAFFQSMSDTIETGTLDGGAMLFLQDDAVTFVAGGHVANAKSLEGPLRKMIKVAENEPGFPKVNLDADKYGDVTFHTTRIPIPANNVQGRQIFGRSLEVVLGVGTKSVYMAVGNNCLKTIRKVMDASGGQVDDDAPQGQFTLSLAPIMKFAANVSGDETAQALADKLKDGATDDKIRITTRSIQRGAKSRIEIDGGVLQLVGETVKARLGGGGGF